MLRTFALTWFAYASYYLGRKAFSITKVSLSAQLGLGTPTLALLDTAFLLFYAIGQVPSGVLGDRFGARRLVGTGLLLSAAACALIGSANAAALLVVCFALNGLAQSTGWPGTTKAIAEWTPQAQRGRVMGWWATCYQVGGVAASALATWLLAHYGFRAAFRVPALCMAAMGSCILWQLSQGPQQAPLSSSSSASDRAERARERRQLLWSPLIYSYGACYFCLKLIRYSLLFWLPYYLHTAIGFAEEKSGYLSTSFELGGMLGTVGIGYVSDRLSKTRNARAAASLVSLLLLAAVLFVYARVTSASTVWHFSAMASVGALLFGPDSLLSGAAAQDAGGRHGAATAVGMVNGMGSTGALFQGALTLGVQQAFGWHALFYAFFGLALLSALCLLPTLRAPRALSAAAGSH